MNSTPAITQLLADIASAHLPEIDMGLVRMVALLELLGNPQHRLPPVVHIAGTNGKGSTAAFMKASLEAAGLRVHRYTSPHLIAFNERIELAGNVVDDATLEDALTRVHAAIKIQPVTFFEATTAAAMLCFAEHDADILLLEVGLGGRLDATNIITAPRLSIITPINYDHQDYLGNTLTDIAHEKAGIMRSGGACISAPQEAEAAAEIIRTAKHLPCQLSMGGVHWQMNTHGAGIRVAYKNRNLHVPILGLEGAHQQINAATAAAACMELMSDMPIAEQHIIDGIKKAVWPARLQRLTRGALVEALPNATIMLDGGHNPHAAKALAVWLSAQKKSKYLWLGMRKTKDAHQFIEIIAPYLSGICTLNIDGCEDAFSANALAEIARGACQSSMPIQAFSSATEAASHQRNCDENATILIAGSLYLAGNILKDNG